MPQGSAPDIQIAQFRSDGVSGQTGLRIPFFSDGYSRAYGLPDTRLENLISEATPLREEKPYAALVGLREIRYSRPALVTGLNLGSGPIRGVFIAPPALGGALVVVSGNAVFIGGVAAGSLIGIDMARFAASRSQMVLVASGVAMLSTGGAFSVISNGVLPPVSDVAFLAGRFIYTVAGSDRFYYSEINDAANVGGLSFATAETLPDPIVGMAILNDEAVFFGASSVEFWATNADANSPLAPIIGRGYQRGCAAQGSIAFVDNALIFIGDNRVVYRTGNVPTRISSYSIEDKLRQCANIAACTAFAATFEGHEFYVLNIPGVGAYAYDVSRIGTAAGAYGDSFERGEWGSWASYGRVGFRGRCSATSAGVVWVGDDTSADIWTMKSGVYTDAGGPLVRVASAFIKVEEGSPRCLNLVLHCVQGVGNAIDPGSAPVAEMRYSDDVGRTFEEWKPASLGRRGGYGNRAIWQRLGTMRAPGRLIEIRVSDPVNVALSHLELNASRPAN